MKLEKEYNSAIIVTGDGDFLCLIDYLSEKKKLKRILIPNRFRYSYLLQKYRSKIDFVSEFKRILKK